MTLRTWLTEEEKVVVEEDLTRILCQIRDQIIELGAEKWAHNSDTRAAEIEIERVWRDVLSGKADTGKFLEVCEKWKTAGMHRL
ncbi:MAG TPA: hypothetical protein VMT12_09465 [Syntrophales bacterium]|nr:hypothetical protein [Syntrophales bacterium]